MSLFEQLSKPPGMHTKSIFFCLLPHVLWHEIDYLHEGQIRTLKLQKHS